MRVFFFYLLLVVGGSVAAHHPVDDVVSRIIDLASTSQNNVPNLTAEENFF